MQFKEIPTSEAHGWQLAHSVKAGKKRYAKSQTLDQAAVEALIKAGVSTVWAFRLETDDLDENKAAQIVADHISGTSVTTSETGKGRSNIFASNDGLLMADNALEVLNKTHSSFGIATLPSTSKVQKGQLVATVKTIPYGISKTDLDLEDAVKGKLSVIPFKTYQTTLICSDSRFTSKNQSAIAHRIENTKGILSRTVFTDHTIPDIAKALQNAAKENDLILLLGVSAIADKRDILPAAVEHAGGNIIQIGMPVDPGNLLMLAQIGDTPIIGIPGCAKSPALNGFDFVLERFSAGLPLNQDMLNSQGIGGLLKEIHSRPEPRTGQKPTSEIAAITLAAGKSSRAESIHKLLAYMNNRPVLEHTLRQTSALAGLKRYAVTGFRAEEITEILQAQNVQHLHNPDYETGMASSIKTGISALPPSTALAFIMLGDMPFVQPSTLKTLIKTAQENQEAEIFIPTFNGKRGNPVLWRSSMFEELSNIKGDKGGESCFPQI